MTHFTLTGLLLLALCANAQGQDRIYRCGNVYTNTVTQDQAKNCKLVEGGNVTVVQGTRPAKSSSQAGAAGVAPASSGPRVNAAEQKSRDTDARLILQSELKNALARQEELLKEYNNGEPDKRGDEVRNHQRYLDRVAALKASLARNDSDIAGIRRELDRLPAGAAAR